jgi:aminocarboxymuconate-semialdehyde decarboxylase
MTVIDLDTHIGPADQWEYVPEEFRRQRPIQVFDRLGRTVLVNPARSAGDARPVGHNAATFELKKPPTLGWFDPEARLKDLDALGIDRQMLNPNLSPFTYEIEPKLAAALCRSSNESIGRIVKRYPDRFLGSALLPTQDVWSALEEAKQCMDAGFHALLLKSTQGGKNLDHHDFWPIYELAEREDIGIIIHPTSLDRGGVIQPGRLSMPWAQTASFLAEYLVALCSLIYGGVLDAYPNLRFCFQEAGATWIPWFLDRLGNTDESDDGPRKLAKHPAEYLLSNFFFTVDPAERALGYVCENVSSKNLTLGSDYPHTDVAGRFSAGKEMVGPIKLLLSRGDLSPEMKEDIAYRNALRFLGGRAG